MRPRGKTKHDTNSIGNISEMHVATRLLELGYTVLVPYGGGQRCDLMIEDDEGQILRVQCKTAWLAFNETVLIFNTANHNVTGKDRKWRHYRDQCDYFAIYCGKLNKVYLIPVDEVGTVSANLRLAPTKNNQQKSVRWAKDYEI